MPVHPDEPRPSVEPRPVHEAATAGCKRREAHRLRRFDRLRHQRGLPGELRFRHVERLRDDGFVADEEQVFAPVGADAECAVRVGAHHTLLELRVVERAHIESLCLGLAVQRQVEEPAPVRQHHRIPMGRTRFAVRFVDRCDAPGLTALGGDAIEPIRGGVNDCAVAAPGAAESTRVRRQLLRHAVTRDGDALEAAVGDVSQEAPVR